MSLIIASCEDPGGVEPPDEIEDAEPKTVTAILYAHGPVFDPKAANWRFMYKKKPIYADTKDTRIAKDAVKRGGSFMNDRYKVKMDITPAATEDGTPHYKITEVLEFTPAEQQTSMPLRRGARKKPAKKVQKRA